MRPRIFLDTMLCIDAATGAIPHEDWQRALRYIENNYRYCISFITAKELFCKLARGANVYYDVNKQPLRELVKISRHRIMPYPPVFALRNALFRPSIARWSTFEELPEEEQLLLKIQTTIASSSKEHLLNGVVDFTKVKPKGYWFDIDHSCQTEDRPQQENAAFLEGIRNDTMDMPEPLKMAQYMLADFNVDTGEENARRLAASLHASFQYILSVAALSKNNTYDFRENASDWGDSLQLMYLSDPTMYFLTKDRNCRLRSSKSEQSQRIILWDELPKL